MHTAPARWRYGNGRLPQARLTALLSFVLRATDLLAMIAAALFAYYLRFGNVELTLEFDRVIARGLLFALLVLGTSSVYRSWRTDWWLRDALRVAGLWAAVFLCGVLYVIALKVQGTTSRLWWGYWFVGTVAASCSVRTIARWADAWARARGHDVQRAVIVGTRATVHRLARELQFDAGNAVTLLGWFSVSEMSGMHSTQPSYLGGVEALGGYVEAGDVHQVWIALCDDDQRCASRVLDALQHSTADIKYVPSLAERQIFRGSVELLNGLPVINLRSNPLVGEARVVKGIEDRVLALVILILIAPVMALIALGVKLSSPGPVMFKQMRHGLDCRPIEVWKFRSMRVHQEGPGVLTQATKSDPRVTRFGRFIRKTSLDELPQFFNVLQGTMSIVGPRPHAIEHNDHYKRVVQNYMQRHRMKPGITGWAQVNGLRGETQTLDKMAKRVEYDLYYMQNWSVGLDIKIIAMTLLTGFFGKTAY